MQLARALPQDDLVSQGAAAGSTSAKNGTRAAVCSRARRHPRLLLLLLRRKERVPEGSSRERLHKLLLRGALNAARPVVHLTLEAGRRRIGRKRKVKDSGYWLEESNGWGQAAQ